MTENPLKPGTCLPSIQKKDWKGKRYYQLSDCETQVLKYPNSGDQTYQRCKRKARYFVNGSEMCEIHAGRIALAALLDDQPAIPETSSASADGRQFDIET